MSAPSDGARADARKRLAAEVVAPDEQIVRVLLNHVPLGDDGEGIEQCSCGVIAIWRRDSVDPDDVRYLATHAEGPDLRWHAAHVATALAGVIADAKAEERERLAAAIEAVAGEHGGRMMPHASAGDCRSCHLSEAARIARAEATS